VWSNPSDFHGYTNGDVSRDLSNVKVIGMSTFKRGGRQCNPRDFFTIQYKGFIEDNARSRMKKVMDSRLVGSGKPVTFSQGTYQVFKCWDLSLIYLREGTKTTIHCPAYLSNGGAMGYSQLGYSKIYPNTPITFELEVLECKPNVSDLISIGKKSQVWNDGRVVNSGLQAF